MKKTKTHEDGFSAVELLATLLIGSIFVLAFYQIYVVITQGNATAKREAIASDIAYSNLRKYTVRPSFTCDTNTDLVANSSAPGQVLSTTTSATHPKLPGPVVETIRVWAPRGCDASYPVKIESNVEFGAPARKVIHATYIN